MTSMEKKGHVCMSPSAINKQHGEYLGSYRRRRNGLNSRCVTGQRLNANQEGGNRDSVSLLLGCLQSNMTLQDPECIAP